MFPASTNLNVSSYNEGDKRKKKHKKLHISSKRKPRSKNNHSRHRKRWDLKNPHLMHANYASDYIGPERLTKHLLGFLGKGKISDSISRLEKIMPENCIARSKHDLDRVLKVSSDEGHSYSQGYLSHASGFSQDGSISSSPSPDFCRNIPKNRSVDLKSQKSNSSVNLHKDNSLISSGNVQSPFYNKSDDTGFCREVITKKLHSAVSNANKVVFPNVSNQKQLVKDLLLLQNQYYSYKKVLSSSNKYESLQNSKNIDVFKSAEKNDFKLNPILTQESPIAKTIENMFPDSRDLSSNSDSEMSDDSISSHSSGISMPHDYDNIKNKHCMTDGHDDTKLSVASSGHEGSLKLIPTSPTSSSGSPVWEPILSPIKFLPNSIPSPKLFYRQKMF